MLLLPLLSPPVKPVTCHQLEVDSPACLRLPLRRKANAACAWPSGREEGAEGLFKLLVYQRLGNELGGQNNSDLSVC